MQIVRVAGNGGLVDKSLMDNLSIILSSLEPLIPDVRGGSKDALLLYICKYLSSLTIRGMVVSFFMMSTL